jgi:hypothetical protein
MPTICFAILLLFASPEIPEEPRSEQAIEMNDLSAHLENATQAFIRHDHEAAVAAFTAVIDQTSDKRTLLRCLICRHLCYTFLKDQEKADADIELIQPLLLVDELRAEFPDYIEGLRMLVDYEGQREEDNIQE